MTRPAAGGAPVAAAAGCDVCRIHADHDTCAPFEVARDGRWVVRHHLPPAPLAGWTFLCTERHVQGPTDLDDAEADGLGRAIRRVSRAVREATGCDRVYAIAFGQGAPHLHVHLVPRFDAEPETAAWKVADWYRAVERGERAAADLGSVERAVLRVREALGDGPIDR